MVSFLAIRKRRLRDFEAEPPQRLPFGNSDAVEEMSRSSVGLFFRVIIYPMILLWIAKSSFEKDRCQAAVLYLNCFPSSRQTVALSRDCHFGQLG